MSAATSSGLTHAKASGVLIDAAIPTTVNVRSARAGSVGPVPAPGSAPPATRPAGALAADRGLAQDDRPAELARGDLGPVLRQDDLAGPLPPASLRDRDPVDRTPGIRPARQLAAADQPEAALPRSRRLGDVGRPDRPWPGSRGHRGGRGGRCELGRGRLASVVDDEVGPVRLGEGVVVRRLRFDQRVEGHRRGARGEDHDRGDHHGLEPAPAEPRQRLHPDGAHQAARPTTLSPTIDPSTSRRIRWARPAARRSSWVTRRIVWPCRLRSSRRASTDLPVARVQRAGRLVGQEDGGPVDDRPGDRQPLPLAAAEGRREASQPVAEAELAEELLRAGPRLGPRRARELGRDQDVVANRQVVEQLEELEDEADLRPPEPGSVRLAEPVDADAVEVDLAAGRPVQPADQVEQGRLAAARRAHDRGHPPGLDVEREPVERGSRRSVVGLRDASKADHCLHPGPPSLFPRLAGGPGGVVGPGIGPGSSDRRNGAGASAERPARLIRSDETSPSRVG